MQPRQLVAELVEDPRMAETWLRVMERNARTAQRKSEEQASKRK